MPVKHPARFLRSYQSMKIILSPNHVFTCDFDSWCLYFLLNLQDSMLVTYKICGNISYPDLYSTLQIRTKQNRLYTIVFSVKSSKLYFRLTQLIHCVPFRRTRSGTNTADKWSEAATSTWTRRTTNYRWVRKADPPKTSALTGSSSCSKRSDLAKHTYFIIS